MPDKQPDPKEANLETARRIMKRLTEMPHRDHADSKVGRKPKPTPKARAKRKA